MMFWFKVKTLFGKSPKEMIDIIPVPKKGIKKAFCWCGRYVYPSEISLDKAINLKIFTKETQVLEQAQRCGDWVRYYSGYLQEYLKGRFLGLGSLGAHFTTPQMIEAYTGVPQVIFKNRKREWETWGRTWKEHLEDKFGKRKKEERVVERLSDEEALKILEDGLRI